RGRHAPVLMVRTVRTVSRANKAPLAPLAKPVLKEHQENQASPASRESPASRGKKEHKDKRVSKVRRGIPERMPPKLFGRLCKVSNSARLLSFGARGPTGRGPSLTTSKSSPPRTLCTTRHCPFHPLPLSLVRAGRHFTMP